MYTSHIKVDGIFGTKILAGLGLIIVMSFKISQNIALVMFRGYMPSDDWLKFYDLINSIKIIGDGERLLCPAGQYC